MIGARPPPQNEDGPFYPRSPYGSAKVDAYRVTCNYREGFGMFATSGMLFNHEPPRRREILVARKITRAVARILARLEHHLYLGNLDEIRDWGFAPEYVEGMWRMLQADEPEDFVLATGGDFTVRDLVVTAFDHAGLNWEKYVRFDERFLRPTEVDADGGGGGGGGAPRRLKSGSTGRRRCRLTSSLASWWTPTSKPSSTRVVRGTTWSWPVWPQVGDLGVTGV